METFFRRISSSSHYIQWSQESCILSEYSRCREDSGPCWESRKIGRIGVDIGAPLWRRIGVKLGHELCEEGSTHKIATISLHELCEEGRKAEMFLFTISVNPPTLLKRSPPFNFQRSIIIMPMSSIENKQIRCREDFWQWCENHN